jgi:small subunit ribosomal protein S21
MFIGEIMKVVNTKDNFYQAMRKFKKKVIDSGLLQTLRDREFYVKPSIAKKIAKGKAANRWKKYLQSQELPKKMF